MSNRLRAFLFFVCLPSVGRAQQPATMIDVRTADSTIRVSGSQPILVRGEVAERLTRVARRLATGAVGLKILAGYRLGAGEHAEGLAVDLTIVDLSRGTEIPMGTSYASADTADASLPVSGREARYRGLLARVMTEEGFVADPGRWWHYQLRPLAISR